MKNNIKKAKFYFTFGSWEGYPFKDGYIIVKAENRREAAEKFKQWFPHPQNGEIVNCSFYYDEAEWKRILERGYYVGREPLAIME